jgi:hypothetical protein
LLGHFLAPERIPPPIVTSGSDSEAEEIEEYAAMMKRRMDTETGKHYHFSYLHVFVITNCSGSDSTVGPQPPIVPNLLEGLDRRDDIFMGMGSVDDQMAIRAQRALMRRWTRRWEGQHQRDRAQPPSSSGVSGKLCACV